MITRTKVNQKPRKITRKHKHNVSVMVSDPIADMLTRIRNANQRRHKVVKIPFSKIKEQIVKILLDEGYILDYKTEQAKDSVAKYLILQLKYKGSLRVINGLKRISKPGLRVYASVDEFPQVLSGFGMAIVSTSKGIMTTSQASSLNLGGEILAFVW